MTAILQLASDLDTSAMVDGSLLQWNVATKKFSLVTTLAAGMALTSPVLNNPTIAGTLSITPQFLAAAGTTQLGATAITTTKAIVNVNATASTRGVRLPVAVTGLEVEIANSATFGVKVYPATNGKIAAVATNGADVTVLAINKVNRYVAVSATKWVVFRGA